MFARTNLQTRVRCRAAWPYRAQPDLLDQFAFAVVVGDSGGDARVTCLGALGPRCGLDDALLPFDPQDLWLHTESYQKNESNPEFSNDKVSWHSAKLEMVKTSIKMSKRLKLDVYLPGKDFSPPLTRAMSSFLLVRSFSDSSVPLSLLKSLYTESASLPSAHSHSSQHRPGTFTSRGFAQPRLGRESSCGHSGMQPTAPSMHVHWCLQLGWKLSPFW